MKVDTWGGWIADFIYPKKSIPQGASSLIYAALEPSFGEAEEDSDLVHMVNDCQLYDWKRSKNAKFLAEESTSAFYDVTTQALDEAKQGLNSK